MAGNADEPCVVRNWRQRLFVKQCRGAPPREHHRSARLFDAAPVLSQMASLMTHDLERVLQNTAATIIARIDSKVGQGEWSSGLLEARFNSADESWLGKIRATGLGGSSLSVCLNNEISLALLDLEECRSLGDDEWFGLHLAVWPDRQCRASFNYDPQCALDKSFYDT